MAANDQLQQGIAALKAGRRERARDLLMQVVEQDERNETAWLWLSGAVDTDEDRLICLENVLAINPDNGAAQRGFAALVSKGVQTPDSALTQEPELESAPPPFERPAQPSFQASAPVTAPEPERKEFPRQGEPSLSQPDFEATIEAEGYEGYALERTKRSFFRGLLPVLLIPLLLVAAWAIISFLLTDWAGYINDAIGFPLFGFSQDDQWQLGGSGQITRDTASPMTRFAYTDPFEVSENQVIEITYKATVESGEVNILVAPYTDIFSSPEDWTTYDYDPNSIVIIDRSKTKTIRWAVPEPGRYEITLFLFGFQGKIDVKWAVKDK